jgi:hypothetical protein
VVSSSAIPSWVRSSTQAISVGPNQNGGRSRDRLDGRKLQCTQVFGVDQRNAIRPWSDVEAAGLTEIEEHQRFSATCHVVQPKPELAKISVFTQYWYSLRDGDLGHS